MNMKYRDVQNIQQVKRLYSEFPITVILRWISPITSLGFIRFGILPNQITLLMICIGAIGPILLMADALLIKLVGMLLIWLWLTLDLSDGEVARLTKTFSKGGAKLDYMAHLVDHPIMIVSFSYNVLQSFNTPSNIVIIATLFLITSELTTRYFYLLDSASTQTEEKRAQITKSRCRSIISSLLSLFYVFPNFSLIFSLLLLVDLYLSLTLSLYYAALYVLVTMVKYVLGIVRHIVSFMQE